MNTGEWMVQNGIDKWLLAVSDAPHWDKVIWLNCPNCETRPFKVLQSEIDEAEGVIDCEFCGQPCQEIEVGNGT